MRSEILKTGYFPAELPPPFCSEQLAKLFNGTIPNAIISKKPTIPAIHNLARTGSLRRILSVVHPMSYLVLSDCVAANWSTLEPLGNRSKISMTTVTTGGQRAIGRKCPLSEIPRRRIINRAGAKYIVRADVARCYPSIYTHSIPWAIHGKITSKTNRTNSLLGNVIDTLVRSMQDGQTMGLPIGPDVSFLIAEIILNTVDEVILSKFPRIRGFRYIDDYELSVGSRAEAEDIMAALQEELHHFELALNPLKTKVIELPETFENKWTTDLRAFDFRSSSGSQQYDILRYCDLALSHLKKYSGDNVLKYCIARISSETIEEENWEAFEGFLLQAIALETGTLPLALSALLHYQDIGQTLNLDLIQEIMNRVIDDHATIGHGSEVAWALWAAIELNLRIQKVPGQKAVQMEDPVVSLLACHLAVKNLMDPAVDLSNLLSRTSPDDLYGNMWLFAYEVNKKGWLSPPSGANSVASDAFFKYLQDNNVQFYEESKSTLSVRPHKRHPANPLWGWGGGGY
jgi:hypothetical protein